MKKLKLQLRVVGRLVGHHGAARGANTGAAGQLERHRELVVQELEHLGNTLLALQPMNARKKNGIYYTKH